MTALDRLPLASITNEPFPLTEIQQAYWLGRQAGRPLGGVATHSYLELEVTDLDLARLESALGVLIGRHDALRTVVRPDGRQQVLADVPAYRIAVADLIWEQFYALPGRDIGQRADGLLVARTERGQRLLAQLAGAAAGVAEPAGRAS